MALTLSFRYLRFFHQTSRAISRSLHVSTPLWKDSHSFSATPTDWSIKTADDEEIQTVVSLAEKVTEMWTVERTGFLSPLSLKSLDQALEARSDIATLFFGGYMHAERQRLLITHRDLLEVCQNELEFYSEVTPVKVEGNFLMIKAEANDFLKACFEIGLKEHDLGDLILEKDTGCLIFATSEAALAIEERLKHVRSVSVQAKRLSLDDMLLPNIKIKEISTVEASLRLDALCSAAFGISRDKISKQIQAGAVEVNWQKIQKPDHAIKESDVISLKNKGRAHIENIDQTKKMKYSIKINRFF